MVSFSYLRKFEREEKGGWKEGRGAPAEGDWQKRTFCNGVRKQEEEEKRQRCLAESGGLEKTVPFEMMYRTDGSLCFLESGCSLVRGSDRE